MLGNDPVYTLQLPRSVALTCLAALAKQPLEQVALAHTLLAGSIQNAEERLLMAAIEAKVQQQRAYNDAAAGP
jgi:hypothetical protein